MQWWEARVQQASYAGDYRLHVRYANALEADIDLSDLLDHPFYQPLKDKNMFAQVKVHEEVSRIVWPNDIDIAPELIFERVTQAAGQL